MIFDGAISSCKTEKLIGEYVRLLNSGVSASKILVLVQNSSLKEKFVSETLKLLTIDSFEKLKVYSFAGLVYNTVCDNWAFLENRNIYENTAILPNLAGLEISQFILKDILKDIPFKGYNSKKSLLHQLFRRYSLIVQNNLTDDEIDKRSKIIGETFAADAKIALKKLLKRTLALRDFDYIRQILLFNFIYKNTDYFSEIEYLIIDDGDEITPVCFDFIRSLKLKDVFIASDKLGSSRSGYLSADKNACVKFTKLFNQEPIILQPTTKLKNDAINLYNNVIKDEKQNLKNFTSLYPSKRANMIDMAIKQINALLKNNVKPSDIIIITPIVDDMLKFSLKNYLHCNLLYITGNEKLIQNPFVQICLTILKLNTPLKEKLTEFDLRVILSEILNIPIKYCKEILKEFEKNKCIPKYTFEDEEFNNAYLKLLNLVKKLSESKENISQQAYEIYENIITFKNINSSEINQFNFFLKQLKDFENIFKDNFEERKIEIITQIENSIISENPYSSLVIQENDLVISTPQKICDNQIQTKYQIWLDTSSDEWIKTDTGPLYNAWVFQKDWEKENYTISDNIELSREKTARILRKLVLCAKEHIYTYSSIFDGNGVENSGGIEKFLNSNTFEENYETKTIIPRSDQKDVLKYSSGEMAISAVPGAGKTTILLMLILKLLKNDVKAENIFVLTYMESAARNFKERIKNIRQSSSQLPNISTIHGLALRIIKENGNYERLGLNFDFEICDDTQRGRIIHEVANNLKIVSKKAEEYDRAISVFKLGDGNIDDKNLEDFAKFYNEYQQELKSQNMIDYDDILISSVKLLKENEDILSYYQDICEYIIEDEAQDSSSIQQDLLNLLSGKYHNIIRCGDINQAITTTFSNADVAGFRNFIKNSNSVNMTCSQRCTKDVWKLANRLVTFADTKNEMQNAFYKIFMEPVKDKNPVQKNAVVSKIFNSQFEEKNYILKVIKNTFSQNPDATIGILLRNNYQVAQWYEFINDSGLKSITRNENLGQKSIFKVIYAFFNMVLNPFDNETIANNYELLAQTGMYMQGLGVKIKEYNSPFIEKNCDDIENIDLAKFYWELNYWLSLPYLQPDELALKIGLSYFKSEIEKSNVYLISTLIKRLSVNNSSIASITKRLGELAQKPSLNGFKFFSEEDENNISFLAGKVQIMTLHKSKGDEFDVVFLPEMSEKNLTLDFNKIKLKSTDFIETIKRSNLTYKPKNISELKQEILEENLRLLYVAITRAKSKLFITVSDKIKYTNKMSEQKPSLIFDELLIGDING